MAVYSAKPAFQRSLRLAEDALVARGVHPDPITLSALGLSVAAGAGFVLAGRYPLAAAGGTGGSSAADGP